MSDPQDGSNQSKPRPQQGFAVRARKSLEAAMPPALKQFLKRSVQSPRVGEVDMGDLRRTTPISKWWGFARGTPVDRFYIEEFLGKHRADVRGRVLEVGDDRYIREYSGEDVTSKDILNYVQLPETTIVADLVDAPAIADESFDCIICTQVLQFVTDPEQAMATLRRILAPDGVLLMTVPCISHLDPETNWDDRWRFTTRAMTELADGCVQSGDAFSLESFGNILGVVAFLHGLAADEFEADEIRTHDSRFDMIVALRLKKAV